LALAFVSCATRNENYEWYETCLKEQRNLGQWQKWKSVRTLKIGIPSVEGDPAEFQVPVQSLYEDAVTFLRARGVDVVDADAASCDAELAISVHAGGNGMAFVAVDASGNVVQNPWVSMLPLEITVNIMLDMASPGKPNVLLQAAHGEVKAPSQMTVEFANQFAERYGEHVAEAFEQAYTGYQGRLDLIARALGK